MAATRETLDLATLGIRTRAEGMKQAMLASAGGMARSAGGERSLLQPMSITYGKAGACVMQGFANCKPASCWVLAIHRCQPWPVADAAFHSMLAGMLRMLFSMGVPRVLSTLLPAAQSCTVAVSPLHKHPKHDLSCCCCVGCS